MVAKKRLPKQVEALRAIQNPESRFVVYGGAAGGGKTWLGCDWLIMSCHFMPGTRWFIGRNNLQDTRESVVITFTKVANWHNYTHYRLTDRGMKFDNGSEIVFLDLTYYPRKDPMFQRFGSKEFTGGWIEEGGEVPFGAFDVLKSRVGRHLNKEFGVPPKILITCNPNKNWLYRQFFKPWVKGALSKDKVFIQSLAKDNSELTEEYIQSLESISDKELKERLLFGNWEYDDDPNVLMDFSTVSALFHNDHVKRNSGNKWITADIALRGSDLFVVGVWYGWVLVDIMIVPKSSGKEVLGVLNLMRLKHQIPNNRIIFDADGVGGFLGGRSGFLPGAIEFKNNSRPIQEEGSAQNYRNLKAQCYYKLAERVNGAGMYLAAITDDEDIDLVTQELSAVKGTEADENRTLDIIPKSIMSQALGRSPDRADMLMMRMYAEIRPKRSGGRKSR